jgi:hypothetical protein
VAAGSGLILSTANGGPSRICHTEALDAAIRATSTLNLLILVLLAVALFLPATASATPEASDPRATGKLAVGFNADTPKSGGAHYWGSCVHDHAAPLGGRRNCGVGLDPEGAVSGRPGRWG